MSKNSVLLSTVFAFIFFLSGLSFGMIKLTDTGTPASTGGGSSQERTNQPPAPVAKLDKTSSKHPVMSKLKQTVNRFRSTHQLAKESASQEK